MDKSETITISLDGRMAAQEVGADGKDFAWSFTSVDNAAVPVQGFAEGSTVQTWHVGTSVEHTWKIDTGTLTDRGVVSKDGRVMTYTVTGSNEKGQRVHYVLVFDKE